MSISPTSSSLAPARRRWIEATLIVGFWSTLFLLFAVQQAIDPWGPEGMSGQRLLHAGLENLLWLLLTPAIFYFAHRVSLERRALSRTIALHVGVALIVAIGFDFYGTLTFDWLLPGVRRRPFDPLQKIITFRFLDELIVYLVVLAAGFAREYFWRYKDRQDEATKLRTEAAHLEAKLAEARLQALRMQLNPHFLFNTLHAVATLVERDPRGVRRMIARLSELLRYTLEHTGSQEVPLREEVQFLEGYLDIQRTRFQGRLEVALDVAEDAWEALVPNLVLQPLVENALKHGISRVEGEGQLTVRVWREAEVLHLQVRDNGPGLPTGDAVPAEGVGLSNTRERLQSLYGTEQSLHLRDTGAGCTVEVRLPYHTRADLQTATVASP